MQEEVHQPPEPKEFVGTSMAIGVLVTLAVMALCGRPLFALSTNPLLMDLPWAVVWLTATVVARMWIRRSAKTQTFLTSCTEKYYERYLPDKAEQGVERFFFVLFRATILLVCAAIILGIVVVAFYD